MYAWMQVWQGSISWLCPEWIDLQVQDTVLFHFIYFFFFKKKSFVIIFVCGHILQYTAAATLIIHHIWSFNVNTFLHVFFNDTIK